jgi:glycosyltransferase involved in cell wall biosynthesis
MSERRRITLVADELRGIQGGGLGTVFAFLAIALARIGHEVEILYFGEPEHALEPGWAQTYERWGVALSRLPRGDTRFEPAYFRRLFDIDRALTASRPDVVIAQDLAGAAYVALRRRQLGLGHDGTLFVVRCSGTRRWITDAARKVRVHPGALAVTVLEQAALELADVVVAESSYMVEWMKQQGWRLPAETHVIPSLLDAGATGEKPAAAPVDPEGRARRLVFFGRLEERKGVRPFAEALNRLEPHLLAGVSLDFLGGTTPGWSPERVRELLSRQTREALRDVQFTTGLDRPLALARLAQPGTLAVMPSLEDNSPSTVYECLERGVPFVASAVGGTAELVAPEDRARVLFEPTPVGIESALRRILSSPLRPARPAFDDGESLRRWDRLIGARPEKRRHAEAAAVAEVRIVTGGDTAPASEPWVVLLDEGDEPADGFPAALLQAQAATGADVVTCGITVAGVHHVFLGEPGALGVLSNSYGGAALIRRSLLAGLGELSRPAVDPDWPLLARLSATGARIVSIPDSLLTRQRRPGNLRSAPADALLVVDELERVLPPATQSLARLAAGLAAATMPPSTRTNGLRRLALRARRLRERIGRP